MVRIIFCVLAILQVYWPINILTLPVTTSDNIVTRLLIYPSRNEEEERDDWIKKWPYTAHRAVVRWVNSC